MNSLLKTTEKRRDRHEILAEILKTAKQGKIKTHIMYKAKLSTAQMNEYIPLLVDKGFIENTRTIRRKKQVLRMYCTTERGLMFLNHLETIDRLWNGSDR